MKIDSFSAKGVYGYLKFDLSFDHNPTILTGPNGSGKTTALRMIQALLTPSLIDLLSIQFSEAALALSDSGGLRIIRARNSKGNLSLNISGEEIHLEVPLSLIQSLEPDLGDPRRIQELIRIIQVKYSDNPTYRAISGLHAPVFLGLDRRNIGFQDDISFASEDDISLRDYSVRRKSPRMIRGSLAAGLIETQSLIRDAFRRIRHVRDQQSERLRKKLLLTGFRYADVTKDGVIDQSRFESQQLTEADLDQQKSDLIKALESVGIEQTESRKELDPFFDRVKHLSKRLRRSSGKNEGDNDYNEAVFEAFLNQANLLRLREQVSTVREFNAKGDQLSAKFNNFVACINRFLSDSKKSIEIDPVGQIKIHRPDGNEVPLSALSSGERQLLVMFGHIFFNSFGDRSNVFVIDEPELSLHLRWQEMLLYEMLESTSRAQFIIATHSPEIVGEMIDHCVGV